MSQHGTGLRSKGTSWISCLCNHGCYAIVQVESALDDATGSDGSERRLAGVRPSMCVPGLQSKLGQIVHLQAPRAFISCASGAHRLVYITMKSRCGARCMVRERILSAPRSALMLGWATHNRPRFPGCRLSVCAGRAAAAASLSSVGNKDGCAPCPS